MSATNVGKTAAWTSGRKGQHTGRIKAFVPTGNEMHKLLPKAVRDAGSVRFNNIHQTEDRYLVEETVGTKTVYRAPRVRDVTVT